MGTIYVAKRGPKGRFTKATILSGSLVKKYLAKTNPGTAYTSTQSSNFFISTKGRAGRFQRVYLTPTETRAIAHLVR